MGKGDKRTAKGKRVVGSYGKSRPHKETKKAAPAKTPAKK
jgi:30S ribosomal protein S31